MMPEPPAGQKTRLRPWLAAVSACLVAGAVGAAEKPMVTESAESDSKMMVAEVALERGDCRAAADQYASIASGSTDAKVAARATQVAIACAQLDAARKSAARWRALDPQSGEASLAAAIVALQLYRLDDARSALTAWRDAGLAGNQDPGQFAALLVRESDATAAYRVFSDVLAGADPTAEVLLAQAKLAQESFDLRAAIKLAERALDLESRLSDARLLIVRSRVMLGEVDQAIAQAREFQKDLTGEDAFIVADLLSAADRDDAAREELQRLHDQPGMASGADRRLGALALSSGDLAGAETRFNALMSERGTAAIALFYLSQIAERRGQDEQALKGYQLLADSNLGLTARTSAARLLLKQGQRAKALQMFDEYSRAHPEEAVEVAAARAQLLAGQGYFDAAIADLNASLGQYPAHPTLEYQLATVLERAGRKRDSVAAFKSLSRKRPDDPGIANALGFTLADHREELGRADKLVQQALRVSPDNPAIQDSQAWVLFRRGKSRDAAAILEHAYRNLRDPEIGAHYGEVLWALGDQGRAHYVWQQALNVDPNNSVLRGTITRLTGEAPPAAR